jgi:hypothetical protein
MEELIFVGKVVSPHTGKWLNNRLVLLFLQSKEIDRYTTSTGEFDGIVLPAQNERLDGGLGVVDGLFIFRIPNTYKLRIDNLGISPNEVPFKQVRDFAVYNLSSGYHEGLAAWIDPLYEGSSRNFLIPSKNMRYTVMVLPGDVSQLPAEIQQPGSVALLDDGRLIAIDPGAPATSPQPAISKNVSKFEQVVEEGKEFSAVVFPINNCGGTAEVKQEVSVTYLHEIIDETKKKMGIELPILDWFTIVAEIENHYGISNKEITVYATTLTVPPGQNIRYTLARKQVWESGLVTVDTGGVEISAPYRILKSEAFEVLNSEQRTCP